MAILILHNNCLSFIFQLSHINSVSTNYVMIKFMVLGTITQGIRSNNYENMNILYNENTTLIKDYGENSFEELEELYIMHGANDPRYKV